MRCISKCKIMTINGDDPPPVLSWLLETPCRQLAAYVDLGLPVCLLFGSISFSITSCRNYVAVTGDSDKVLWLAPRVLDGDPDFLFPTQGSVTCIGIVVMQGSHIIT